MSRSTSQWPWFGRGLGSSSTWVGKVESHTNDQGYPNYLPKVLRLSGNSTTAFSLFLLRCFRLTSAWLLVAASGFSVLLPTTDPANANAGHGAVPEPSATAKPARKQGMGGLGEVYMDVLYFGQV